jgi:hypothetical protein
MTKTLAADGNNDIYLGTDGSLAIASGLQATLQAAQQAAQTQLAEMEYAVDQGLPNFAVVWNGAANLSQFDAYLRRALLAVAHVTGIRDLSITKGDNKLSYTATIETDYGPGVLNG